MEDAHTWTDLARYRRHSLLSVRVYAAMLAIVAVVLWGLSRIMPLPWPLVVLVVGVLAFSVVGDLWNILYLNAQIRRRVGPAVRQQRQPS